MVYAYEALGVGLASTATLFQQQWGPTAQSERNSSSVCMPLPQSAGDEGLKLFGRVGIARLCSLTIALDGFVEASCCRLPGRRSGNIGRHSMRQ